MTDLPKTSSKRVDLDDPVTDVRDTDEEECMGKKGESRTAVLLGFSPSCVFSYASSNCLPELIHIHIGCVGDKDEEEWTTRMGKKGGEWKGYLARVGRGSSSWWHSD